MSHNPSHHWTTELVDYLQSRGWKRIVDKGKTNATFRWHLIDPFYGAVVGREGDYLWNFAIISWLLSKNMYDFSNIPNTKTWPM